MLAAATVPAAERYAVSLQDDPTLPRAISDVAQDEEGFLWVSSAEGLFRFDGTEFARRGEAIGFDHVVTGPGGRVVAGKLGDTWYEWAGGALSPVVGVDGEPVQDVQAATFDAEGALWLVALRAVLRRDAHGAWSQSSLPEDQPGRSAAGHPEGGILAGTYRGAVLRVRAGAPPETLVTGLQGMVSQLAVDEDGAVIANLRGGPNGGIVRARGNAVERLAAIEARPTGLALRKGIVWSSWDTGVVALRPGSPLTKLHPRDGFHGGGHVRVDREGALWLTSIFGELVRFPEPETRVYTERSGLEHALVREIARAGDTTWAASWYGAMRFQPQIDGWERFDASPYSLREPLCGLSSGALVTTGILAAEKGRAERGTLVRVRGDRVTPIGVPRSPVQQIHCAGTAGGGAWVAYGDEILELSGEGETLARRWLGAAQPPLRTMAVEPGGTLWAIDGAGSLCRVERGAEDWECHASADLEEAARIAPLGPDRVWVATLGRGLLECNRTSCRTLLDAKQLGSGEVVGLVPSPRGGMWVLSRTAALRVRTDPGDPQLLERLSRWQGVPPWWLASLSEDPDGTVWVVGLAGIARVPPSARSEDTPPLVVRPIRLAVGGHERPLTAAARATSGSDTVELSWAALSYRDPTRLRYRFRLDPSRPWVETESPQVVLVAPRTGTYRVETAATLDPGPWSTSPAPIELRVVPPWYLRGAFLSAVVAALAAAGGAAYRQRVRQLLRLERQRTQIAMDLHDDLGATLSGIGLLASLADDEMLQSTERRQLVERIARQTGTAGSALSDIVWSLRPGAESMDQLVLALRERAFELCPDGLVQLRFDVPDPCPRTPLTLPVRRNVLWIAVEALRNALRHGEARHVAIRLAPEGPAWRLTVEDDGRGLGVAGEKQARRGLGLESMRRRGESMRADVEVVEVGAGGTRVSVLFRPDGRRPRTIV
jgi:signal transduction histidine kinase/ligand-binding sensor domain-containing protein